MYTISSPKNDVYKEPDFPKTSKLDQVRADVEQNIHNLNSMTRQCGFSRDMSNDGGWAFNCSDTDETF